MGRDHVVTISAPTTGSCAACCSTTPFAPAITYLTSKIVGDEFALKEQYENLQQHRRLLEDLR